MELDFALLERLPECAVLLRQNVVERCNDAARRMLPQLEEGKSVPGELSLMLAAESGGGEFALNGKSWQFSVSREGERQLLLIRPAPQEGMNRAQMKGTLRQARQILGQLLLDLGEEQPDPGRVARGVYRMARLLENAQTVDSGEESVFTPAALDLAGLCRAVVQQADELLSQVGVAVEIRQMPASLILSGDETLLQRMVLELLANAAAAAGRGRVVLSLQQHAGRAVLSVTDSGHGPGGQDYLRLLRPEQELLPRPGAGAGLGLDMVRQVARLHGGAVLVTPDASGRALVVGVSLPMGAVDGHAGVSAPVERGGGLSPVLLGLAEVLPSHLYSREDLE